MGHQVSGSFRLTAYLSAGTGKHGRGIGSILPSPITHSVFPSVWLFLSFNKRYKALLGSAAHLIKLLNLTRLQELLLWTTGRKCGLLGSHLRLLLGESTLRDWHLSIQGLWPQVVLEINRTAHSHLMRKNWELVVWKTKQSLDIRHLWTFLAKVPGFRLSKKDSLKNNCPVPFKHTSIENNQHSDKLLELGKRHENSAKCDPKLHPD